MADEKVAEVEEFEEDTKLADDSNKDPSKGCCRNQEEAHLP